MNDNDNLIIIKNKIAKLIQKNINNKQLCNGLMEILDLINKL